MGGDEVQDQHFNILEPPHKMAIQLNSGIPGISMFNTSNLSFEREREFPKMVLHFNN